MSADNREKRPFEVLCCGGSRRILRLNLKTEYWQGIRAGRKAEEFRLATPYWTKRLGHPYAEIHVLRGYPRRGDKSRLIRRRYNGIALKTITHPHFGARPVKVFAIDVSGGGFDK